MVKLFYQTNNIKCVSPVKNWLAHFFIMNGYNNNTIKIKNERERFIIIKMICIISLLFLWLFLILCTMNVNKIESFESTKVEPDEDNVI